jgi:hypothetical protein
MSAASIVQSCQCIGNAERRSNGVHWMLLANGTQTLGEQLTPGCRDDNPEMVRIDVNDFNQFGQMRVGDSAPRPNLFDFLGIDACYGDRSP